MRLSLLKVVQEKKFSQYFLGVINTSLTVDNTMLGLNYERFKRNFYRLLKEEISDNVMIEIFEGIEDQEHVIEEWAKKDDDVLFLPDKLKWMNYGGEGKTRKDLSLIRIDIQEKIEIPVVFFQNFKKMLESPVLIEDLQICFYEYGIGVFTSKITLNLTEDIEKLQNLSPKEFQVNILKRIIEYPKFLEILENTDKAVNNVYKKSLLEIDTLPSTFYKNQLNMEGSVAEPLWAHILTHYQDIHVKEGKLPFKEKTNQFVISGHPKGLINFIKADIGYIHLGWLTSVCCDLSQNQISQTLKVFKRLEFEGRFYQVLNNIIFNKLHELASHTEKDSKSIKENLKWMEKFRIEYELFLTNRENFWSVLSPFAYNIYINTRLAWRLPQQEKFFIEKLDTLKVIHKQGKDALKEKTDQRLNNFILLLTLITTVDTIASFILFDITQFLIMLVPMSILFTIAIILIYYHRR